MAKRKTPMFFVLTKTNKKIKKPPMYAPTAWAAINADQLGKKFEIFGMSAWDGFRPSDEYGFAIADFPRFHETIDSIVRAWQRTYPDLEWDFQILWSDAAGRIRVMPFEGFSIFDTPAKKR